MSALVTRLRPPPGSWWETCRTRRATWRPSRRRKTWSFAGPKRLPELSATALSSSPGKEDAIALKRTWKSSTGGAAVLFFRFLSQVRPVAATRRPPVPAAGSYSHPLRPGQPPHGALPAAPPTGQRNADMG